MVTAVLRQNHICLITIDFSLTILDIQRHAHAPGFTDPSSFLHKSLPIIRSGQENSLQCALHAPCSATLTTVPRTLADDFMFELTASGIQAQSSLWSS